MSKIATRSLAQLCQRIGTALRAGVDVRRVFRTEADRSRGALRQNLSAIANDIDQGHSLGESFDRRDAYFPVMARRMIRVGEMTGRVEDVFLQLSEHYDQLHKLKSDFYSGIAWPGLQFVMSVLVVALVIWLQGWLVKNDILGFGLTGTSGALIFLMLVFGIVGGIVFAANGMLRGWFGPGVMSAAMQIPKIGQVLRDTALARFSWSLAVALDAGMDARGSMQLALDSTSNRYFTAYSRAIDADLEKGHEFHKCIRHCPGFTKEFIDGLSLAELSGTHSESMHVLAREYELRARQGAKLLIGVAVGVIWLAIMSFIIYFIYRFASFYLNALWEAQKGF